MCLLLLHETARQSALQGGVHDIRDYMLHTEFGKQLIGKSNLLANTLKYSMKLLTEVLEIINLELRF